LQAWGQIALSPEDLDHLGTLIRQRISPNISEGTRFLGREAPTCLACFLVWTGIVGYRDGDYWSAAILVLGVFFGSALWWFILVAGVSIFRERFNASMLRWVNIISGVIITGFGLVALLSLI